MTIDAALRVSRRGSRHRDKRCHLRVVAAETLGIEVGPVRIGAGGRPWGLEGPLALRGTAPPFPEPRGLTEPDPAGGR